MSIYIVRRCYDPLVFILVSFYIFDFMQSTSMPHVTSMRFLVAVNVTEYNKLCNSVDVNSFQILSSDPCIATIKTPALIPGKKYTKNESIHVGDCDQGPLVFNVHPSSDTNSKMVVDLVYYSTVIEDAMPPVCNISWNGTYLVPKTTNFANESLLPGCFVTDSREGWHLTYYWFYILDWTFA